MSVMFDERRAKPEAHRPALTAAPSLEVLEGLARQLEADSGLRQALLAELSDVEAGDAYQAWTLREGEGAAPRIADGGGEILRRVGLLAGDRLSVKLNLHRGCILLTDGLWAPGAVRVFPFIDESELLLTWAEALGLLGAGFLIDPATGAGSHVIGAPAGAVRFAYDVNPRAVALARVNALLNGRPDLHPRRNDIRAGFPGALDGQLGPRSLVLANMPFALSPGVGPRQLSADGGADGGELSLAVLRAVAGLTARASGTVDALVLCYSLGSSATGRWRIEEQAKALMGATPVRWRLLPDERLWRVNGRKSQSNPMRVVEGLPLKAQCRFTVEGEDPAKLLRAYERLAADLVAQNWDLVGYGLLHVGRAAAASEASQP